MLSNQLAATYAQAVFELAAGRNALDQVENELRHVEETIRGQADLATLMYHPRVPAAAKKETVEKVFGAGLTAFVRNFLFLLIDKRRESALPAIVRQYIKLANQARNIMEAEVTSAMPLTQEEEERLRGKLSQVTGRTILLKPSVDPSILGGVIVKIGDKLIDGSVVRQLKALEKALLRSEGTKIGVTG